MTYTWNSDAFFAIGKTHAVCQDYAVAGVQNNGFPYAIVCDGCSSSPDTDIGARLLGVAAAFEMNFSATERGFDEVRAFEQAHKAAKTVDLDVRVLDTTLVAAWWDINDDAQPGARVRLRGDGFIVARTRTGEVHIHEVEHPNGAPYYLSYAQNGDVGRHFGYLNQYGSVTEGYTSTLTTPRTQTHTWGDGRPEDWFFPADDYDLVIVMSDGVASFQRVVLTNTSKALENIPVEEVVRQVSAIKGFKGHFLQRRCNRFLTRFCTQNAWQHNDDFSAAAIWMGTDESSNSG